MDRFIAYAPERSRPWWFHLIGVTRWAMWDGRSVRCWWGEFATRGGFGLKVTRYGDESPALVIVGFGLFTLYVHAAIFNGVCPEFSPGENLGYGAMTFDGTVHVQWGRKTTILHPFWDREHYRTDHLHADGVWRQEPKRNYKLGEPWVDWRDTAWSEQHPYRYLLRSGEVQQVTATIRRERMEWRWRWFGHGPISQWLRRHQWWGQLVRECIDVRFSDEVGERAGSWKGGCIGCGYEMKPGESPRQALKRMEEERRF